MEPTATQRSGYVRDGIYPAPSGRAIGGIAEAGRAPNDAGATASRSGGALRVASRSKGPAARPLAMCALRAEADRLLDHADMSGRRWIDTALPRRIPIAVENTAAALEARPRPESDMRTQ